MTVKTVHAMIGAGLVAMGLGYTLARVQAEGAPKSQPLWYSGSVADASGKPLETKNYDITLGLYERQEQQAGEMAACSVVAKATRVVDGRFRIDVSECASALQKSSDLFAELVINAGKPFARAKVGAVPFALEAQHAVRASEASPGSALLASIPLLQTGRLNIGMPSMPNWPLAAPAPDVGVSASFHVAFSEPFIEPPQVQVMLGALDSGESPAGKTRVTVQVKAAYANGFTGEVSTWDGSSIWQLDAVWIAIGKRR